MNRSEPIQNNRKETPKLLIIEDDDFIREDMKWALSGEYHVVVARNRIEALNCQRTEKPAVATLDLGLPPAANETSEGMLTLSQLLEADPDLRVIVITGQDEKENAVRAIERGAYDFFPKPIDPAELKVVIRRAVYLREIGGRKKTEFGQDGFEGMLGRSPQIREVFEAIKKVAPSDAPVLLSGDSGTGKELAAQAIHRRSPRKGAPFVPINCGAIPSELLESELFGHEKGAFTGAHAQQRGRFERAQGGTLFLDEIGELPTQLQVKLLRFLQEGQIERVGGREELHVDARVIAATNQDLERMISEGTLREDLYYRLAVIVIPLPPLHRRQGDVELLAEFFLRKYAEENQRTVIGFARDAQKALAQYVWPGNVRELENRVRRAVIMANGARLSLADMGLKSKFVKYEEIGLQQARDALERDMVSRALLKHGGNKSKAAAELKISRPSLYDLLQKFNLDD